MPSGPRDSFRRAIASGPHALLSLVVPYPDADMPGPWPAELLDTFLRFRQLHTNIMRV